MLSISTANADRLLKSARMTGSLKGRSTTKPGALLKQQIEIRTHDGWDDNKPGYFEIDLVAHCADSGAGEFLYTLTLTDICTQWTEVQPIRNKGQIAVLEAIVAARKALPFPMIGLDSDNGSEFINHHLHTWCKQENIALTRCRPYKKNDQCQVEQKNWTIVTCFILFPQCE